MGRTGESSGFYNDATQIIAMQKETLTHPFAKVSQPAQRALANAGIHTLEQLSALSEKEILKWHGIGKASLPVLTEQLAKQGLVFKK